MATLASDIMDRARAYLNDVGAESYDNTVLLPYLQLVYEDFILVLEQEQIPSLSEIAIITPVLAGATTLTLPADYKEPVKLAERNQGATSEAFIGMQEMNWEPDVIPGPSLIYWTNREDEIKFVGATTNRDVKLYYIKDLLISGASTPIPVTSSKPVLSCRLAEAAARFIGENNKRGDLLQIRGDKLENKFLGLKVGKKQFRPTRRPGFRERRRAQWLLR